MVNRSEEESNVEAAEQIAGRVMELAEEARVWEHATVVRFGESSVRYRGGRYYDGHLHLSYLNFDVDMDAASAVEMGVAMIVLGARSQKARNETIDSGVRAIAGLADVPEEMVRRLMEVGALNHSMVWENGTATGESNKE